MVLKKSIVAVILAAVALIVSSCSVYTCPTYSKAEKEAPSPEARV